VKAAMIVGRCNLGWASQRTCSICATLSTAAR
jgi:hypothetical protein